MTPTNSSKPERPESRLAAWARKHRARLIPGTLGAAALLILAAMLAYLQPHTWRYYTDGIGVRRLAKDVDPRPVLWEDARFVPCPTNLPADLSEPFVLADGVTMMYTAGGTSGNADLFTCRWNGREWADPTPLPALNSAFNERGAVVSPDGQHLFFSSDRPGGLGGYDVWVARWDGVTWAWPANLGYMINSKFDEFGPAVAPVDGRLFFSSNRAKRRLSDEEDRLPIKELRERFKRADADLYAADPVPADAAINREIERLQSQLYSLRTGALGDPEVMRKLGGSKATEEAVSRALAWLAKNQETNGSWCVAGPGKPGGNDSAATGFALLTFLGRGHKPGDGTPYGSVVSNALAWLVRNATLTGDMRAGGNMYNQGVATLALTEAYGLTKDDKLKEPVQAAVNFLVDAQHEDGGWRYTPKEAGDLSVSGWQIMALKSAELSGLMISETCLAKAREWLREKMVTGPHKGSYGYTAGSSSSPGMQAAGFYCAQLLGITPNSLRGRESAAALAAFGVDAPHIYYWYNAVLASYQYQGPLWEKWNTLLLEKYLPGQILEGDDAGSWDPAAHQMGSSMGRVIVTAMFTLSMEVYYRYTPLYGLGYKPQPLPAGREGWDADRIGKVPLYRRARPVDALNTSAEERRPSFTRRGDFVYFTSNRGGGSGGYDLYRARASDAKMGVPENLGPEVNSPADEMSPATRLAGFQLLFVSNRDGGKAGAPRLFASTSRYVRALHDYTQTRGMLDQLNQLRLHLVLLLVALCCLLLFLRRCRRSLEEDRVGAAAMVSAAQLSGDPQSQPRRRRRRRGTTLAWIGLALSLIFLLGLLGSVFSRLRSTVWCRYTDDVSITKQAVDVKPRPVVWEYPAPLASHFTGLVARSSQHLTPEGAGVLFSFSNGETGTTAIAASAWDGYEWSARTNLPGVNSVTNHEQDAVGTRDGQRIFFASDRPGGLGGLDIWTATRSNGTWVAVTNLGAGVNSPANEVSPAPAPDGSRLFFASDRTDRQPKDYDLFASDLRAVTNVVAPSATGAVAKAQGTGVVTRVRIVASPAVALDTLNTKANELHVSLTERGDWLNFASDRKRGRGRCDAYSARLLNGRAGVVANLGTEINTPADEEATAAGMEGFQILFRSDRGEAASRPFAARACEVTGRWDFSRWYSLADLLYKLRWWILALLAALAGIIYILTHLKDITSLRAKCILVSVLIHLIFLLLTSLWIISRELKESRAARNQELSVNIDALAQEKLALDVREEVMELPESKITIVAEQAEEALPIPDFKPAQRAVQYVVARSVTESFVEEQTPSTGAPETREAAPAKTPDLPEIQQPKLDVVLKVENPMITMAEVKAAEAFMPNADVPSVSTTRVAVVVPTAKPVEAAAGVADVAAPDTTAQATVASLVGENAGAGAPLRDTGGSSPHASSGADVSTGMTELKGPGSRLTGQLAGGTGDRMALNFPGKLDVPKGLGKQISPYKLRMESHDNAGYLEGLGGDSNTEGSVGKALAWLTRHQEPDGRWDIAKYQGAAGHDVAASGLALLCYLGWGTKHNEAGQYQPPAAKAVKWLVSQVKADGDCRGGGDMYDHGIATIALGEACALSKDEALRPVVSNMVQFILKAQHAETGGWRYQPGQTGDTSVFGWQLMAVMGAKMAGFTIPDKTLDGADKWLTSVGGGERGGLYGYESKSPARGMAAEAMFCRQIMGAMPDEPRMQETAAFLSTQLPDAGQQEFYYWYYGTLAMYQHRGESWTKWNERIKAVLPPLQATTGDDEGSWAPGGSHGGSMGRVVSTAMATLTLEVYYRYLPFAFTKGSAGEPAKAVAPKAAPNAPKAAPPPAASAKAAKAKATKKTK